MEILDIVNLLQELDVLGSSYEVKVLAYFINHPLPQSGKEVSESLGISNSKIYPALNSLVECGLVARADQNRPQRYYLQPPEVVSQQLHRRVETSINERKANLKRCVKVLQDQWHDAHPIRDREGVIFHREAVLTQVDAMARLPSRQCRIILGSMSKNLLPNINELIEKLLKDYQTRIELATPHSRHFIDSLNDGLRLLGQDNVKQSKLKNESYIEQDGICLFIQHQAIGDVAFFVTEDQLLTRVRKLWYNSDFVTSLHRILRFE